MRMTQVSLPVNQIYIERVEKLMTPKFVLGLWTVMNFFTYYDRGAIASSLTFIRDDPDIAGESTISDAEGGVIASAFMVGFFVACPIFAALGGTFTAKRIITGGLLVWALACFSTAISQSYWMILISRMFVGVGEAAYAGYTVTIIDNMAPTKSRTLWIGIYYSMIAVGTALGMTGGGIISELWSWRAVFATEIFPMVPIIVLNGLLPAKYNPVKEEGGKNNIHKNAGEEAEEELKSAGADHEALGAVLHVIPDNHVTLVVAVKELSNNIDYILLVLGYSVFTFVLGAAAVWSITVLVEGPLHMGAIPASLFMGGTIAITGLLGSILGGMFVDRMADGKGTASVLACCKYLVGVVLLSVPCGIIAFLCESILPFAIFFICACFLGFSITAPVNAALLSIVPLPLRTYSVSFSVFFIHMLGDFPSPVIAGLLSDAFGGGCNERTGTDETTCTASHSNCRWVLATDDDLAAAGEGGECVNIYQLRNALLIIWTCMLFAVPCWGYVGLRAWRRLRDEREGSSRGDQHAQTTTIWSAEEKVATSEPAHGEEKEEDHHKV